MDKGIAPSAEWLTIETAPKDGTKCLFFAPGNPRASNFNACIDQIRVDHFEAEWPRARHQLPEAPYTHWMPLPSPPNASEG